MSLSELQMRCDLFRTGANAHKLNNLFAVVHGTIELYLLGSCECNFLSGVESLHKINAMLHTNFRFTDLIVSYIPRFDKEWGCTEVECLGSSCTRISCIRGKGSIDQFTS